MIGRRPIALGLVWALAAGACSGSAPSERPRDRVRAIVMPYLTLMPFYIAEEEGFFDEQGLDVEFIRVARNQDIMAALATGDVDVAGGMLTINELNLVLTGARVRMVASLGDLKQDACPSVAVLARRSVAESGALDDPARIRTMRFDVDELVPIGFFADVLLQRFGLGIDDVSRVNMPSPVTLEAFKAGTIDVTVEGEPFVTMLEAAGDAVVWERGDALAPDFEIAMMMYGPTLLDERPDVGDRFAVAILKAIRQYRIGKTARNLTIVEHGTGLAPAVVASACWPVVGPDARIHPDALRGYQEWSVGRGLVGRVLDDDELFDLGFMERANAALGPVGPSPKNQ